MPRKITTTIKGKVKALPKKKPRAKIPVRGRPRVYSSEEIMAAIEACQGLVWTAAKKLGCNYITILNRMRAEPEIAEKVAELRGRQVDLAEKTIFKLSRRGSLKAAYLVVSHLGQDRGWTKKKLHLHQHTGEVSHTHVSTKDVLAKLPLEVKKQILQIIRDHNAKQQMIEVQGVPVQEVNGCTTQLPGGSAPSSLPVAQ